MIRIVMGAASLETPLLEGIECGLRGKYRLGCLIRLVKLSLVLNVVLVLALCLISFMYMKPNEVKPSAAVSDSKLYLAPDYRDAIHLLENRDEIANELEDVLISLLEKINEALYTEEDDFGYQLAISFGCFELLNIAKGGGFKVKRKEDVEQYFSPINKVWNTSFTRWSHMFEYRNDLSTSTPFRVASVSKIFTSLLAYRLRDEGLISLDEEFASLWPEFSVENLVEKGLYKHAAHRNITLRMALNQMTGLKRDGSPFLGSSDMISDVLNYSSFTFEPYFHFEYSNQMVALLGLYMSARMRRPFKSLIQEKILNPLEMRDTFPDITSDMWEAIRIGGNYGVRGGQPAGVEEYMNMKSDFGSLEDNTPSGGIVSTASDLLKLLQSLNPNLHGVKTCRGIIKEPVLDPISAREYLSYGVSLGNDLLGIGRSIGEIYQTFPNHHKMWSKAGALGHYGTFALLVEDSHIQMGFSTNGFQHMPGAFFDVFNAEENLVGPVRSILKRSLRNVYGGSYRCMGEEDGHIKVLLLEVAVSKVMIDGSEGNPNEYLNVKLRASLEEKRRIDLSLYSLNYDEQVYLLWSGLPFRYYFGNPHFSPSAGYGNKGIMTLMETEGGVKAHTVDFRDVVETGKRVDRIRFVLNPGMPALGGGKGCVMKCLKSD